VPEYPAAYPEVLAVAAVGPDGTPAPYSNFGSYVGIRAPGGNFALGDASDGVLSTMWNFGTNSPDYAFATGTSMAAPHVSGVAALVLAQAPGLSPAALRTRLTTYAVGPATAYGAGLVDAYNSLTQTHGPPTQLFARLYSASTGATVSTVPATGGGGFAFSAVPDGVYLLYGGTDERGDEEIGLPGRAWAALGGLANPTVISILDGSPQSTSLTVALPPLAAHNNTLTTASRLIVGGYVRGQIVDSLTLDLYKVTVPTATSYTFETSGWVGACGLALEEATAIGLFSAGGTLMTSTGYVDPARYNYCSRLTLNLNAGSYIVAVAGVYGRRYQLQARTDP
jgi:hypothetical protein